MRHLPARRSAACIPSISFGASVRMRFSRIIISWYRDAQAFRGQHRHRHFTRAKSTCEHIQSAEMRRWYPKTHIDVTVAYIDVGPYRKPTGPESVHVVHRTGTTEHNVSHIGATALAAAAESCSWALRQGITPIYMYVRLFCTRVRNFAHAPRSVQLNYNPRARARALIHDTVSRLGVVCVRVCLRWTVNASRTSIMFIVFQPLRVFGHVQSHTHTLY